jgi:hypothetical protein
MVMIYGSKEAEARCNYCSKGTLFYIFRDVVRDCGIRHVESPCPEFAPNCIDILSSRVICLGFVYRSASIARNTFSQAHRLLMPKRR